MDKVFIRGLEVLTTIGVYEWEKAFARSSVSTSRWGSTTAPPPQPTISSWHWITPPSRKICDHASSKVVELVETMAEQVAMLVLADERVQWVKVTLTKPGAVPNAAGVGVEILRHRTPAASAN
ncbi:dihydroneopterin aldolase [Aeromonas hydrophila]|uniref:dihydroneopterin aldolase n=1 Tax=Aeromonas hydrophila TaxID=644 RepID=A0A926FNB3_AERHY|nr:dihydroneopterin aldolase [Aeromonas hydrophila]